MLSIVTAARFFLGCISLALLALTACGYGHRIAAHVLEGPMDAIAVTHLNPDKLLVLAGDEDAKGVSVFHDSIHSQEVLHFGVSRYASDIQAGNHGSFFVSLAIPRAAPRYKGAKEQLPSGAIQEWNLSGQLLSTVLFPAPVEAISKPIGGVLYALMTRAGQSVVVGLRLADAKVLASVALPYHPTSLDQCRLAGQVYLLTADPATQHVYLTNVRSDFTLDTSMIAEQPRCFAHSSAIAGIVARAFGSHVSLLRLSLTDQRASTIVAPSDIVGLETAEDGRLFLLRRFGSSSNIQIWTNSELAAAGE